MHLLLSNLFSLLLLATVSYCLPPPATSEGIFAPNETASLGSEWRPYSSPCLSRGSTITARDCVRLGTYERALYHRQEIESDIFHAGQGKVFNRPDYDCEIWISNTGSREVEVEYQPVLLKAMTLAGKCQKYGGRIVWDGIQIVVKGIGRVEGAAEE